jgi:hypothetical protein
MAAVRASAICSKEYNVVLSVFNPFYSPKFEQEAQQPIHIEDQVVEVQDTRLNHCLREGQEPLGQIDSALGDLLNLL